MKYCNCGCGRPYKGNESMGYNYKTGMTSSHTTNITQERISMTPADEIEKVAKEFFMKFEGYEFKYKPNKIPSHGSCCTCQNCGYHHDDCICSGRDTFDTCRELAAHVIRERKKAVIEARINEQMVYGGSKRHERIPDLTSRLADLERGEK